MGEEIEKTTFEAADFAAFEERLKRETAILKAIGEGGRLSEDGYVIGYELEAWLLDHAGFPKPDNHRFLEAMASPFVTPELSRFNVELGCDPLPLAGKVLSQSLACLSGLWAQCEQVAHGLDANVVMIGTLPVLRDHDLSLDHISELKRYAALNSEALRRRHGKPLVVDIQGEHAHLRSTHHDVMLEAAATSFQVHLKTPARLAHRYYNASIMASAPILAAAANAPFVFGMDLWRESRIPLFEQSVPLRDHRGGHGRVTFGTGYAETSLIDPLVENADDYPVLLPILFDEPESELRHLRLHNGTIWRWNRPLIGFEADGTPHLRIEHRPLPAGPTMIDMIANAALYFGLVRWMVDEGLEQRRELSFEHARENMYAAARHGLDARFAWPGGHVDARDLILDQLLPAARQGLAAFDIDADDADLFLGIIAARVRTGQTGAVWQRSALARRGGDLNAMMSAYCEGQRSAAPVHEWDL